MDALINQSPEPVRGVLSMPADKAICHRAALVCALASGSTEITPWSSADDCQRTLELLKGLGVEVSPLPRGICIDGVGLQGLRAPQAPLDCGESGTTIRLSCGLLAGQPFRSELTASGSLRYRPMRRVIEPLKQMGAHIQAISPEPFEGNPDEDYPPLEVEGRRPLRGITYTMPVASAQVKSAVLLAGLYADGLVTIIEPATTRDHTERLLRHLGAVIRQQEGAIIVEPSARELSSPGTLTIPGDASSAAFFIVAGTIVLGSCVTLHGVGLNPSRIHFLNVLRRMGAAIRWEVQDDGWEPRGTITVESAGLRGTTVAAEEVPLVIDELPILMVASCAATGQTRFNGVQELRVKETDRLRSMVTGLQAMGGNLLSSPEGSLTIEGGRSLQGVPVESFGDHRTAMSLAIAGLLAEGTTRIHGAECVGKSFGNFFELLARVTNPSRVQTVDAVPL